MATPDALLAGFYARPDRKYWAGLSRQVLALAGAGEPHAEALWEDSARALAELALLVNQRLGLAGPVVLAGGVLLHQPVLRERVRALLAGRGIVDVRALDRPPVWGALALADELLTTNPPQEGR